MNFILLAPAGLLALAALLVPLLIHLVRRLELRLTDFAALRWLSDRVRPQRRVRIERPWLLLVRVLLLGLLALLLARPALVGTTDIARDRVLVAPGVSPSAARGAVSTPDADWRWLAAGFPPLTAPSPEPPVPLASLLREADARLPAARSLHVVVASELGGLDGARPTLGRTVDWQVVPGRMPEVDDTGVEDPRILAVRHEDSSDSARVWLRAAVRAWSTREPGHYELDAAPATTPLPGDAHWLVWLGGEWPQPVASWIERGGTALVADPGRAHGTVVWRDADGDPLARVEALGRGRIVRLSVPLDPASLPALLDADFPDRLLALLQGPSPAPTRARADAMRPLHDPAIAHVERSAHRPVQALDAWLVVLIAALFLLERLIATRRADVAS